jgi:hypothetical protein
MFINVFQTSYNSGVSQLEIAKMFNSLSIPFGAKMLFNVVRLKPGYTLEDAELTMGEMCNVVKNSYGEGGGFIAGQVFSYAGFVSEQGTLGGVDSHADSALANDLDLPHLVIITYWQSFEQHERSHADDAFKEKFSALMAMCDDTFEIGYDMLWQGEPESPSPPDHRLAA